jgi:hypothetical protein
METPILQTLAHRVDRLEAANLQWKRLASMAMLLLGIAVLFGAATSKPPKTSAELRARRLVLVDTSNKKRAELALMADDQLGLILSDEAGNPRLTLSLTRYGEPSLSFVDAGGTRRIVLGLDLYGALLQFTDHSGNGRVALVVPSEGEPELELMGKDDKVLWHAP